MKYYRKIFLGVMSLLLLVVTFTTTTYAWFKINSSASVEGFDFEVNSGEGFWVSIDGENYSRDLSLEQMKKAIIAGYDPNKYEIKNNQLVDKETNEEVSGKDLNQLINKQILLLPRTTKDGINFSDLYGSNSVTTEGSFVEFSIYFDTRYKATEEKLIYEIYLAGQEITLNDSTKVNPTSINSEVSSVPLLADMNTINGNKQAGQTIQVYAANAMRMSTQDTSLETPNATIYELTNEHDLGSYATDYSGEDEVLSKLYNADQNAMFTYYNNLRSSSKLQKLKYEEKPQTIRTLNDENLPKVTTLDTSSNAKLITFRFWLEGWDADCFDGLDKSVSVKLSFTSKRVNN